MKGRENNSQGWSPHAKILRGGRHSHTTPYPDTNKAYSTRIAIHATRKMNKHPGITNMIQGCRAKYYYPGLARKIRVWVKLP